MLELLRAIRVGAVNLFGVAIPGFLLLFVETVGFLLPLSIIALLLFGGALNSLMQLYETNKWIVIAIFIVVSYVTGYILRLTSPDELDEVSGEQVLEEMEPDEKTVWPYTGKVNHDKFPYLNLHKYLQARGLTELLELVPWGSSSDSSCEKTKLGKRSKTAIHEMKLAIALHAPELAAIVESNEAHIRLMSGTWIAIKRTEKLVFCGCIACILAAVIGEFDMLGLIGKGWQTKLTREVAPYFIAYGIAILIAWFAMRWAKRTIERLFHYRRVNEVVWIVMSAHEAKRIAKKKPTKDPSLEPKSP